MMGNNRNPIIDYARGIAIFLVLWGHSIQCIGGDEGFFSNPMIKFIYSFHMPLFMMISGYLFFYGKDQKFTVILKKRLISIVVPFVVWGLMLYIRQGLFTFATEHTLTFSIQGILHSLTSGPWFLKSVFIISILTTAIIKFANVRAVRRFRGLKYLIFSVVWIALIICSDWVGDHTADLFPFFAIGFAMAEYVAAREMGYRFRGVLYGVFALFFVFFRSDYLVYVSGIDPLTSDYGFWPQIGMDIYRLAIGTVGSLAVIFSVKAVRERLNMIRVKQSGNESNRTMIGRFFNQLGRKSLQIYVLQCFFLEGVLSQAVKHIGGGYGEKSLLLLDLILSPTVAFIYAILLLAIIWIIDKIPFLPMILFGRKNKTLKSTGVERQ